MRLFLLLAASLTLCFTACESSEPIPAADADAQSDTQDDEDVLTDALTDAESECDGTAPDCADSCLTDVLKGKATCENGAWSCPQGFLYSECPPLDCTGYPRNQCPSWGYPDVAQHSDAEDAGSTDTDVDPLEDTTPWDYCGPDTLSCFDNCVDRVVLGTPVCTTGGWICADGMRCPYIGK